MQRITQARAKNKAAGEPILMPFKNMKSGGTFIRKGQLTLIAAAPGGAKSAVTQSILQRGDDRGNKNSVFYFCADSSPWDLFTRAAAIETGRTIDDIEREAETDGTERLNKVVDSATRHMMTDFRSDPDDLYITGQLEAYAELYGRYPEVIVMDNLKNLELGNGEDEFRALEDASVFLHDIAKDTNAAVIALHHVRGDLEDGYSQLPLSGIRGKVSKTPSLILTLWRREMQNGLLINASVVKARGGKGDPSGNMYYPLMADLSRMSFIG